MTEQITTGIDLLREMDLFWGMTDAELQLFLDISTVKRYEPGDLVFREADPCDQLYIVADGLVEISIRVEEGVSKVLGQIRPGTLFGEMALIDDAPRSATAKALELTRLICVFRDRFLDLIGTHPTFSAKALINLARTLSNRLRVTNKILRESIDWNLKISGVEHLNLKHLLRESRRIRMNLNNHDDIKGLILKVEKDELGYELTVQDDNGQVFMVPYHAVTYIEVLSKIPTSWE